MKQTGKKEKEFRKEIRLSGSGGQGLITAGIILAKAAVLDDIQVTQTQSYGPESRGGASRADVILSTDEIYFPEAIHFDYLLCLTQEACDKYAGNLKDDGILIIDTTYVKNVSMITNKIYEIPFTEVAVEKLGTELIANILSLSFLVKVSEIVSEKSLKEAITSTVKEHYVDLNLKAMKLGYKLAEESMVEEEEE
jgi:2-oxoglutarate ferredoxin oxidoreductase subunit gamma